METPEIDARLMPVVDAFSNDRQVSRGKMMSSYGLKVRGKIFAMFGRGRFVVKLPKKRVEELVGDGQRRALRPRSRKADKGMGSGLGRKRGLD